MFFFKKKKRTGSRHLNLSTATVKSRLWSECQGWNPNFCRNIFIAIKFCFKPTWLDESVCRWRWQAANRKATLHLKMQDFSWCDDLKRPDFSGSKEHFSNIYSISREHQHHISINLKVVLPSVLSFWVFKEDSITCHSWALVYPTINQACWRLAFLRCEEFLYERINFSAEWLEVHCPNQSSAQQEQVAALV